MIKRSYTVVCSVPDCGAEGPSGPTVAAVLRLAERAGWNLYGKDGLRVDLCPDCCKALGSA